MEKFYNESKHVNAVDVIGLCVPSIGVLDNLREQISVYTMEYDELLSNVDAVFIHSHPEQHYSQCKKALSMGKHVLCESPIALKIEECQELFDLAEHNGVILMEANRTAYITAYERMLLLLKSGKIGKVVSVDATCTSLGTSASVHWGAFEAWGPTTMLPVFQILGTNYNSCDFFTIMDNDQKSDLFCKVNFMYPSSTATVKVGTGVKSEGELVISGTKGYVYVPAPWWKTDYFEIRFENASDNKRYFYQVDGEGIRYELVALANAIREGNADFYINRQISAEIAKVMDEFNHFISKK